jgi:hypothetical protein
MNADILEANRKLLPEPNILLVTSVILGLTREQILGLVFGC